MATTNIGAKTVVKYKHGQGSLFNTRKIQRRELTYPQPPPPPLFRDVVFGVNRLTDAFPSRVRFSVVSCHVRSKMGFKSTKIILRAIVE